jgi:seryl-tRNA synthetase
MLDPQQLRRDTDGVAQKLLRRRYTLDVEEFSQIESDRKILQSRQQVLQKERNRNSKEIGRRKASGEDVNEMLGAMQLVGSELETIEQQLTGIQDQLSKLLQGIPNIPHESVPDGTTEADNLEIRRWGKPRKFEFEPQDHVALGVELGMMDFDGAAKISGSRFVVLSGLLSRLQRALTQFMLDLHTRELLPSGSNNIWDSYLC